LRYIFASFFKDKKSKRSHKTVGIKRFFLLVLLDDRRIHTSEKWIRIQKAQRRRIRRIRWIRIRDTAAVSLLKKLVCTGEREGAGEGGPAAGEEKALRAGQASLRALQYCILVSTAFSYLGEL
jgi:hypothetical protein